MTEIIPVSGLQKKINWIPAAFPSSWRMLAAAVTATRIVTFGSLPLKTAT